MRLRTWLTIGYSAVLALATLGLEGMAPGVDLALRKVLGSETVDSLAADGRTVATFTE